MIKDFYFNLSIKYKILIPFYIIIVVTALILGLCSAATSEKYVINRVSLANLNVVKQLNSNVNFLIKDIVDISTYLCIDSDVQTLLKKDNVEDTSNPEENVYTSNSLKFIMNLIASKSYISSLIMYSNKENPIYYEFTDMSSGANTLSNIKKSEFYKKSIELDGGTLWFSMPETNNILIQNNAYPKIGMCRIVKNFIDYKQVGFLAIGINQSTIRNMCMQNLQNSNEGIIIVDNDGNIVSSAGADFYGKSYRSQNFFIMSNNQNQGLIIEKIEGKEYLIAYSSVGIGWKTFYAVPMKVMREEINSTRIFTLIIVIMFLMFSFPLMMILSSLLTAPIKKLLNSMKKFEQGNFEERVKFKYRDEIGQLGEGYNNMVANIKELIDKAYILQIKERESELNALQAQINPHFLYNTLDTIFWKAQRRGEKEISEIVFSLSKLFRLSLNSGKGKTLVSREKELVEHYLLLQKVRFKDRLNYKIDFDFDILNNIMPKLVLQPFVENSILHGIEKKAEGGTINISGKLINGKMQFLIQDDGVGMDKEKIKNLLEAKEDDGVNTSTATGGYAVRNVDERLRLYYGSEYALNFSSKPDEGTTVEITIPAVEYQLHKEVKNGQTLNS